MAFREHIGSAMVSPAAMTQEPPPLPLPSDGLRLIRERVRPEWIDYNGHMNVAWYVAAFDQAGEAFLEQIGLGAAYCKQANASSFSVEAHITYQREVHQGDLLEFRTKLIGFDAKKIHYIQMMYRVADGLLSSTAEWLILYVDMNTRRTASMPEAVLERLRDLQRRQADLPLPPEAGRAIKQKG
jgi:acyl-CoA thioester hydrolase